MGEERLERPGAAFWMAGTAAVAIRPRLWVTALRQAAVLARPGWWRHAPYLPLPDPDYLRFRMEAQYGPSGTPDARDLVMYLQWCREADR